ncbi:hypothetical protein NEUTE2DRAFT_141334 [Neurospora tetrasperma FGSC 2509]|nr:hypothetical protein NEUTE2DRAFT_141334 [Neurospora tetrasperma FGSC 2509]
MISGDTDNEKSQSMIKKSRLPLDIKMRKNDSLGRGKFVGRVGVQLCLDIQIPSLKEKKVQFLFAHDFAGFEKTGRAILHPKLLGLLRDHPKPHAQRTMTFNAKELQGNSTLAGKGDTAGADEHVPRYTAPVSLPPTQHPQSLAVGLPWPRQFRFGTALRHCLRAKKW